MLRSTALRPFGLVTSFFLFSFAILMNGCGSDYRTAEEKNFILHANSSDKDVHLALRRLTEKFNQYSGFTAIQYTEKAEESNSPITLVKNLVRCSEGDDPKDKKIGCGQWLADVSQENGSLDGSRPRQLTTYHMRIELDDEWFRTHMNASDSQSQVDVMKLFFHEVGHGLKMGHDPEQTSVMYRDISGNKDFNAFFVRVREFFAI